MRFVLPVLAALVLVGLLGVTAAGAANPTYPARTMKAAGFGTVLASSNLQALYYWSKEPRGTIPMHRRVRQVPAAARRPEGRERGAHRQGHQGHLRHDQAPRRP